ncbi:TPA: hypothetical protein DIS56_01095 [Candidatus Saccharibacteria bacterium]|nr:hypothetical protein [Candidatus Saccharibacteria bacterium]
MRVTKKGFISLEVLLILFIAVLLAGTGWYVLKAKDKASSTYSDADAANSSQLKYGKKEVVKEQKDPTADWVAYSSTEGKYSLKYPKTWAAATNPESCSPGILLLGGNAGSVGKCATESFGQISVVSTDGDSVNDQKLSTGYKDVTSENVTVNNVAGTKMSGTASGQSGDEISAGMPDGTKVVKYIFYTNGKTYTANYIQMSTYPDVLSDFNLLVTKTLKFQA